jgi:chromosome segregation ATPase
MMGHTGGLAEMLRRMEKQREIMQKIAELTAKVNVARESRIELSRINQEITFSCENWNSGLASFESGEMSVVVVVDRYEGESAETIRNKLPDIIEKMQNTNAEATGVQGEIAEQISRLDEYIEKLEVKIGELRQQLAAL